MVVGDEGSFVRLVGEPVVADSSGEGEKASCDAGVVAGDGAVAGVTAKMDGISNRRDAVHSKSREWACQGLMAEPCKPSQNVAMRRELGPRRNAAFKENVRDSKYATG